MAENSTDNTQKHWFQYIHGTLDVKRSRIKFDDAMIRNAQPFDGHRPKYLDWPDHLWKNKKDGVPCEDPEKNAYHVLYLARLMEPTGQWLTGDSNKLSIYHHGFVREGNHRLRAVEYLFAEKGIVIQEPENIEFSLYAAKDQPAGPRLEIVGSIAILAELKPLMKRLCEVVPLEDHPKWLTKSLKSLSGRSPLDALQSHEFETVRKLLSELP